MSAPYKIFSLLSDFTSCGYYRVVLPHLHLKTELAAHGVQWTVSNQPNEADYYDAYIFGRVPDPATFMFALKAFERGAVIIWDLDDDFLSIPEWSPVKEQFGSVAIAYLEQSLKMSTWVTVSTVPLAEAVTAGWPGLSGKVKVLENLVDTGPYFAAHGPIAGDQTKAPWARGAVSVLPSAESQPRPTKILWSGSDTHVGDIQPVRSIMEHLQTAPGFVLIMYGYIPNDFKNKKNVIHIPWGAKRNYEGITSLVAPDVAMLPLKDCKFNRCKSIIKFMEMTMSGAMCVASDVQPFSDVIIDESNGLLVNHDDDYSWINAIKYPLDRMAEIQKNGRRDVVSSFSWQGDNIRRRAWRDFFVSLC